VSSLATATIAFALILGSAIAGALLRAKLPEHHLSGDSKDVIKLATALIGTMTALVLALLFASTRTSYEHMNSYVSRMAADLTQLDVLLTEYGSEAEPVRKELRTEVGSLIDSIWRQAAAERGARPVANGHHKTVLYMIRELTPKNPVQASIQARAVQVGSDLAETRANLAAQPTDSLSHPFIIVLVLWLMFIFTVFAMSSPPNATLMTVLFLCVVSASGAIYLILEMAQPFDGLMQLPNEILRKSLK
jgi:hypothetical protein